MDGKHQVLQEYFGYDTFRHGQGELIDALLSGRDAFGVMPTGGGKSLCYQVPALLLPGVTVVVSPLISLMRDQVLALKKAGVGAAYLNSSLTQPQMDQVCRRLLAGSRAEVDSSISSTSGLTARARAMHSRCCWPPDRPRAFFFSRSFTSSQMAAPRRERSTMSSSLALLRTPWVRGP